MSDIRKLVKDLDRGIQMRKNLPVYAEILSDTYVNYAAIELVFSAYLLAELIADGECQPDKERYEKTMELLPDVLERGKEGLQEMLPAMKALRNQITAIMEVYTSYTDRLLCYEYVLERMKLRFSAGQKEAERVRQMDDEEFLQRLMVFLLAEKDQSIVRERLQLLMGQIPVHMTKGKLLEKVSGVLTLYQGSDAASLDEFVYMIRSAAMINHPDSSAGFDKEIEDFLERMERTEFLELDESSYQELTGQIERISEKIFEVTDFYYSLQKVVNDMYALCLARIHKEEKTEVFCLCEKALNAVVQGTQEEQNLVKLEGKIEHFVEKSSYLEAVLSEVKSSHQDILEEMGLQPEFEDYARIASLLSDSLFVDIDAERSGVVDAEKIKKVSAELTNEFTELFQTLKKPVKRAVTALVLEKLPVDFTNAAQIEAYIRTNLLGCQDFSEKGVVMLELEKAMRDAAEWEQ